MRFDFTLTIYRELVEVMKGYGYNFYTMSEWIERKPETGIVIRHDVDRRALNSLRTAEIEHATGINATYYFRITKDSFRPEIIEKISLLGHETGYHYEDLTTHCGDEVKAIESFSANLNRIRKYTKVKTIAMHGKPISKYSNLDLWKRYDMKDFGITGEAYLTPDYSKTYYFSDTGRSWKSNTKTNYKDYTGGLTSSKVRRTQDLIEFIRSDRPDKMILVTHPERWSSTITELIYYKMRDTGIHLIKAFLSNFR
ncbi:MAG: hypothetical protein AB2L26_02705 [Ignavibacteria bacterium]